MYRARFPKPIEQYKLLQFFGGNIVASEGDDWKRYRKISAPAFSEVSKLFGLLTVMLSHIINSGTTS